MLAAWKIFVVTAYSWGCGATGNTAYSLKPPVPYVTVAVDRNVIAGGSILEMDAPFVRGRRWYAEDTGGCTPADCSKADPDMIGHRIDLMLENCEQAKWWGRRKVRVRVIGRVTREQHKANPNLLAEALNLK